MTRRILLLAGTAEARTIADALFDMRDVWAVASMAGATRQPIPLALPCRIGGFGGEAAFAEWLSAHKIEMIVDATHPFAHRISARAARVAAGLGIAYLQVLRPEWRPRDGDNWVHVRREDEVAQHVPEGATVFLATGRQTLDRFANLAGRRVICRLVDPPEKPFPFENGAFVVARPPFTVPAEVALFRKLGVDWLVVKNAGGLASRAKLDAARRLGLPVAMIARPPQPDTPRARNVDAALRWIRSRL